MQASTSRCAWLCSRPLISAASTAPTPASLANPTRSMSVRAYRRRLEKKKLRRNKPPSPTAMTFSEALRVLKAVSPGDTRSAFDLTLLSRLAASVNVNSLRGRAFLPHDASSAKKKKLILVFAEGDLAEVAKAEGADVVGGEELVDKLVNGDIEPTSVIAAPDQLSIITRSTLPRILGPKGLMPSAKRGTVTSDLAKAIREAKGGLDWLGVPTGSTKKGKKSSSEKGVISVPIGRITFTEEQVAENVAQFAKQVENVLNGVGTQAEIGEDTSERKRGQIEKLLLGKSRSFSVEVTDFKDLIKNASSTTSASSPEHVTA